VTLGVVADTEGAAVPAAIVTTATDGAAGLAAAAAVAAVIADRISIKWIGNGTALWDHSALALGVDRKHEARAQHQSLYGLRWSAIRQPPALFC
jgi:hypothetical protein